MPEARSLPLHHVAKAGRYGAGGEQPGVLLSVLHPVTLVLVIARRGKSKAVADQLNSLRQAKVREAGADQYFVEGVAAGTLKEKLGATASVVDQSHGRVVIKIVGPRSRAVLAKGSPVDLHPDHFAIGQSAMTQMAHVGVHITRTGKDEFTLSVFRGFSESFWEWLAHSAAQFGYSVQ